MGRKTFDLRYNKRKGVLKNFKEGGKLKEVYPSNKRIIDYHKKFKRGREYRTKYLRLVQDVEKLKVFAILLKTDDIKTDSPMFAGLAGMPITGSDIRSGKKKF